MFYGSGRQMQLERHLAELAGALKALKQEQQADAKFSCWLGIGYSKDAQ